MTFWRQRAEKSWGSADTGSRFWIVVFSSQARDMDLRLQVAPHDTSWTSWALITQNELPGQRQNQARNAVSGFRSDLVWVVIKFDPSSPSGGRVYGPTARGGGENLAIGSGWLGSDHPDAVWSSRLPIAKVGAWGCDGPNRMWVSREALGGAICRVWMESQVRLVFYAHVLTTWIFEISLKSVVMVYFSWYVQDIKREQDYYTVRRWHVEDRIISHPYWPRQSWMTSVADWAGQTEAQTLNSSDNTAFSRRGMRLEWTIGHYPRPSLHRRTIRAQDLFTQRLFDEIWTIVSSNFFNVILNHGSDVKW